MASPTGFHNPTQFRAGEQRSCTRRAIGPSGRGTDPAWERARRSSSTHSREAGAAEGVTLHPAGPSREAEGDDARPMVRREGVSVPLLPITSEKREPVNQRTPKSGVRKVTRTYPWSTLASRGTCTWRWRKRGTGEEGSGRN